MHFHWLFFGTILSGAQNMILCMAYFRHISHIKEANENRMIRWGWRLLVVCKNKLQTFPFNGLNASVQIPNFHLCITILGAADKAVKALNWQNMRKCRRSCRRFFWSTSALSLWTLNDSPPFTLTTIGEKAKAAFYELQTIFKFQFLLFHYRTTAGQFSSTCSFSVAAVGGPVWLSFPMDYKEFVKKWTKSWLPNK